MSKPEAVRTGSAVAFFNCRHGAREIGSLLPKIREFAQVPPLVELTLTEGPENVRGERKLTELANEAKKAGMQYVMEAKYPGASNRQTAEELGAVMNQTYQSPLYVDGEEFRAAVFYKAFGEYTELT